MCRGFQAQAGTRTTIPQPKVVWLKKDQEDTRPLAITGTSKEWNASMTYRRADRLGWPRLRAQRFVIQRID
ncbi:MAG TPA: hypothetical protein VFU63_07920, partial [Ktedonobacterales bacterium]|nr:hypothetical protein [Ktedonobacterales bacterium]